MKQQGSLRAVTGLGQHLRRHHSERHPGIDDLVRQAVSGESPTFPDRVETDLFSVADTLKELGKDPAVIEIRGVHDVSGSTEFIGEGQAPRR